MRKIYLLTFMLISFISTAFAQQVSVADAMSRAKAFLQNNSQRQLLKDGSFLDCIGGNNEE